MRNTLSLKTHACVAALLFVVLQQTGTAQATKVSARLLHTVTDGYANWWSPDARTLAVYNVDMLLYDAATAKLRATIKPAGLPSPKAISFTTPKAISFTPDGSVLIIQTDRVRLYDVNDGKLLREFGERTMPINYYETKLEPVLVSPSNINEGQYADEFRGPYDYEKAQELPTVYISDRITSPDGKFLLVRAKKRGDAEVYDSGTGELKFTLEPFVEPGKKQRGKRGEALGEFSADGKFIVTSHEDRTPRLWNAATGALIADLAPQTDTVYGVRFSPDSKLVATTSFDGIVKIWDAATGKLRHTIGSKKESHYFAVWNPQDNTFVTKSPRKWEINIWNAATGMLVAKLDQKATKDKFDDDLTFEYSPDGKILLTKATNNRSLLSFMAFEPKKKLRFIAHLWDARTGSLIVSLRDNKKRDAFDYYYDKFFWSPAGDYLVTTGAVVRLWNRQGELMQELDGGAAIGASLSPDGKLLALTGEVPAKLGAVIKTLGTILVGKTPQVVSPETHVWQIESTQTNTANTIRHDESAVQR